MQVVQVEKALTLAEPGIGFLEHHNICIQLKDHILDSQRIEYAVISYAFVNIVGGNRQLAGYGPILGTAYDAGGATFQLGEPRG